MSGREQPYDPYIPSGGNANAEESGNPRIAAVQKQLDTTLGIMKDNLEEVGKRGQNIDQLQDKTDNLAVSAQGFRRGANRVRKQMWWKDMKMRMCIIAIIVIIIIIAVVVPIATKK